MGGAHSREKRRGGRSAQRGRARVCEFRVGELVTLKAPGTGVYEVVAAEEGRVKLCNINDPLLAAWFDVRYVEPYPAGGEAYPAENISGTISARVPRTRSALPLPGTGTPRPDSGIF